MDALVDPDLTEALDCEIPARSWVEGLAREF